MIGFDDALAAGRGGRVPGASTSPPTRSTRGSTRPRPRRSASGVEFLVVQDTNVTPLAQLADVVLAGATFAEKAGCYVNADGRLQYAEAALPPRDGSLPDLDLFAILLGPRRRPDPLARRPAELAEAVPAFAVAGGGKLPDVRRRRSARPPVAGGASGASVHRPLDRAARATRATGPAIATPKGGRDA